MDKFKKFCIQVGTNSELMRTLQDHAFKLGYKWSGGPFYRYLNMRGLYFYSDGSLAYGSSGPVDYGENNPERPIVSVKEFLSMSSVDVKIVEKFPLRVKGPDYDDEFSIDGETAVAILELLEERGYS